MADLDSRFDRVAPPRFTGRLVRDGQGKEALYSTAPGAPPTAHLQVVCERCDVESGLRSLTALRLFMPPLLYGPFRRRLWARCPACQRRSWLRVRWGQALRALLGRQELGA